MVLPCLHKTPITFNRTFMYLWKNRPRSVLKQSDCFRREEWRTHTMNSLFMETARLLHVPVCWPHACYHTQYILSPKYNSTELGNRTADLPYSGERVLLDSKSQPSDYLKKSEAQILCKAPVLSNSLISVRQSFIFYYL